MDGLSLTKTWCNAWISAWLIEDSVVLTRACISDRLLCNARTCAWPDSTACRVRSTESTTLCTRSKTGGGVSRFFADWSVAYQVLFNLSRRPSWSSKFVACPVSSRANTNKRTSKLRQASLSR